MKGRSLRTSRRSAAVHVSVVGIALIAPVLLTACGGGDDDEPIGAPAVEAAAASGGEAATTEAELAADDDPVLVAPSTTAAPTTTSAPTTSAPATTTPPTVVVTLPTPAPPPEPRAQEPYVELGRLEIPKIGIDTTLLQGITLNTLDLGPGHWPGTALPGQIGNTVVAGHRTSHNKIFRHLDQLVAGDEVIFTTADGTYTYLVRETTIVKPDAMYIIDQTVEPTATLFACHPPGSTRERIVVHLELQGDPAAPSV